MYEYEIYTTIIIHEKVVNTMTKKKQETTYNVEPLRTPEEISEFRQALLDTGSKRDEFMFTFGINTGLRISDILPLKVSDVLGKVRADIIEQKTNKVRHVTLTEIASDIVAYCEGLDVDAYLFRSRKEGSHISTTQAYRVLNKAADWIGRKDIGTHTMRKTFGYHYYKRTHDAITLMNIFGHSAPSITKKYIGVTYEEQADSLKGFRL